MAQVLGNKEARTQMEAKRRRQLLINFSSDDEGAPHPSAHMVYWVLTEQLSLSQNPSNGVQAIYAPNPTNQWRWCVLFNSENLKSKFEGKTITYTHNHNNKNYTYTFKTTESNRLMITVQSSPLISDAELGSYLEPYGKIVAITQKKHNFAHHIDSGLRLIFIILQKDVKARDIPWSIRTSDGVWRKLFFKGKVYSCRDCGTKHSHSEGCPIPQQDEQTHQQETNPQETDPTETVPVPNNTIPKTHNPTTQLNSTKTKPGPNRTHSQPRKRIVTQTEPDNTTENNNKGEDDTITGTPSSQEVDFPQSPCVVSELTRNNPSIHPSAKNRELNDKIQKSMVKIRANHTGTPRRRTKQIEPRRIVPWRT